MLTMNELRSTLGRPPVGTFVKIPAIQSVEILKLAGFDFIIIDGEHAPLSMHDLDVMIMAARSIDLPPIVRVPDHGYSDVQRVLDAGAAGVMVPHVSDLAEANRVLSQMVHPPLGTRGAGNGMRAGGWGLDPVIGSRYSVAEDTWRILMIEEYGAVERVDEILTAKNLSAIFIGPSDLSMSMGLARTDAEVVGAITRVREAAKSTGVPVGTVAATGVQGRKLVDEGYDFVVVSNDTGLLGAAGRDAILATIGLH